MTDFNDIADRAEKAADLIEGGHWAKNTLQRNDAFCALGAIARVSNIHLEYDQLEDCDLAIEFGRHLFYENMLSPGYPVAWSRVDAVWWWNDKTENLSEADVTQALRDFAIKVRPDAAS